jgi:hypothetical protein
MARASSTLQVVALGEAATMQSCRAEQAAQAGVVSSRKSCAAREKACSRAGEGGRPGEEEQREEAGGDRCGRRRRLLLLLMLDEVAKPEHSTATIWTLKCSRAAKSQEDCGTAGCWRRET